MKKLLVLACILSGCMVGPNYAPPQPIMPLVYSEDRPSQTCVLTDEGTLHWWNIFGDECLNSLLNETIQNSFDFAIALERVYQARANYWIQFTQILPQFEATATAVRSRTSQSLNTSRFIGIPYQNFYQAGFDSLWEIDVFGKLRRGARAARDRWEASREDARGVEITVLAEVANIYTIIRALQEKRLLFLETVQVDEELYQFSKVRFDAGLANEREVESSIANLEVDRAELKNVETFLKQAIYSLAPLVGRPPETLLIDFVCEKEIPYSVGRVPAGLPSDLLRRRPDIRSAERLLAAATEDIGVAVAELFPSFQLTGSTGSFSANPLQGANYGWVSNTLSKLFTAPSRIWGLGTFMNWTLFDFGKRRAAIDLQVSLKEEAFFAYEKTVITALQEVESFLIAYFNEQDREKFLSNAVNAEKRALNLVTDLYQAGLTNYTEVLQVKESWLSEANLLIDSRQALTSHLIGLYKAMGGEWECICMP